MTLDEYEKKQIEKEIENLERKSSAELVAVTTVKSSSYRFESVVVPLIITSLISFILVFSEISSMNLFQIQFLVFITLYFIFNRFDTLLISLLPKAYRYEKASQKAKQEFVKLGLHDTKTKKAIMFYVSKKEKYVEIISDSAIKEKIDDKYWQKIIDEFIQDVKNHELANGYLKAINSCSNILIENFPIEEDDENELSNEVIELN